jgi:AhpC/TSA family
MATVAPDRSILEDIVAVVLGVLERERAARPPAATANRRGSALMQARTVCAGREDSMTLEERLATIREQSRTRMAPEVRAVLLRSIDDLRASGIEHRVAKVGSRAPDFTLPNAAGELVSLGGQQARGPVVLSFYRGRW